MIIEAAGLKKIEKKKTFVYAIDALWYVVKDFAPF